jgi:dephospho-CoA kinase
MLTVGLTGGIATGKSTVAEMLRGHGCPVLDADVIARQVVEPGTPVLAEIAKLFGAHVLQRDGSLDRKALGAQVMGNPSARKQLEGLTHPAIFAGLLQGLTTLRQAGERLAFVEAALMVESGSYRNYGELWVVTCSPAVQRQRLMARNGFDESTAKRWIASQLPLAEKEAMADQVLRNDASRGDLERLVATCLSRIALLT